MMRFSFTRRLDAEYFLCLAESFHRFSVFGIFMSFFTFGSQRLYLFQIGSRNFCRREFGINGFHFVWAVMSKR